MAVNHSTYKPNFTTDLEKFSGATFEFHKIYINKISINSIVLLIRNFAF